MKREIREAIWHKYDKRCAYCGCELDYKDMQVDHIHSKFHHEYFKLIDNPDRIENLNPACRQCNFYKGSETLDVFRKNISTIYERLSRHFIFKLALKYGIIKYKEFEGEFYFEKIQNSK